MHAKLIISHFDIDKSHANTMMFYIACFMSRTALVSKFNHKKLKFSKNIGNLHYILLLLLANIIFFLDCWYILSNTQEADTFHLILPMLPKMMAVYSYEVLRAHQHILINTLVANKNIFLYVKDRIILDNRQMNRASIKCHICFMWSFKVCCTKARLYVWHAII